MDTRESEPSTTELANGSAAAALLAAGVGATAFGLSVVAADVSGGVADALNLVDGVGPLSGKALVGVGAWAVSWFLLARRWSGRQVEMRRAGRFAVALMLVGFALTFPPVFGALAEAFE